MADESQPEVVDQDLSFITDTLYGDLRDHVLDQVKHERDLKPWAKMSEAEQRECVERVERWARATIGAAVRAVAALGRDTIHCKIRDWKCDKDGNLRIQLEATTTEHNVLFCVHNSFISVVASEKEAFMGETRPSSEHIEPDQRALDVDQAPVMDQSKAGERLETEGAEPPLPEEPADIEITAKLQGEYDAGRKAFDAEAGRHTNPNKPKTKKHAAWDQGWRHALDESDLVVVEVMQSGDPARPAVLGRFNTHDAAADALIGYFDHNGHNRQQRAELVAYNGVWINRADPEIREKISVAVRAGDDDFHESEETQEAPEASSELEPV